jgi:arylsulfatase A-like enzyme
MTSKYPRRLFGVDHDYAIIPDQAKTTAEFFKEEGLYTMGFMASPWTSKPFNFHQGFDYFFDTSELLERYKTEKERRANRVWGDELTKKISDQLEKTNQSFFLQIMYTDIHWPYTSFPPFREKYQIDRNEKSQVNRYDETILHFDAYVGQLVETLRNLDLLNDTLIIITSDHGEAFGKYHQYDKGHAYLLYNTVLKIPLIFYNPNLPSKGILADNYVTSLDILPTTLDIMGIKYNRQDFDGTSQIDVFKWNGNQDESERLIVSETNFKHMEKGMKRSCAIWDNRWKLIQNYERTLFNFDGELPAYELYDLKNDGNEINNLIDQKGDMAERLTLLLQGWQEENTLTLQKDLTKEELSIEKIDPEIKDQLKALGYID